MTTGNDQSLDIQSLLEQVARVMRNTDDLPPANTPVGKYSREFFRNTWTTCQEGLLSKTRRIRVTPEGDVPRMFHFEMDLPYRQRFPHSTQTNLLPGPIRGVVMYRPDLMSNLHEPSIAVRLDQSMGYFHPNFSRRRALVCLGDLPPGPFPLDVLLEHHLFPILSYQNRHPVDPADGEAARYFATDPGAMTGLDVVTPLY